MKKKCFFLYYTDLHILFLLLCTKTLLKFEYVEGYLYLYAHQYRIVTICMENEISVWRPGVQVLLVSLISLWNDIKHWSASKQSAWVQSFGKDILRNKLAWSLYLDSCNVHSNISVGCCIWSHIWDAALVLSAERLPGSPGAALSGHLSLWPQPRRWCRPGCWLAAMWWNLRL